MFDPVLFVFLNKPRNRVKILYWERNGFCLWLKRLGSERLKTSPDPTDAAIFLTVQELNWLLDGFDLWRNVSVRRTHLPNSSIKGDGVRVFLSGRDQPYHQDCHAPTKLLPETVPSPGRSGVPSTWGNGV